MSHLRTAQRILTDTCPQEATSTSRKLRDEAAREVRQRIMALRDEADRAGDDLMARTCDSALQGDITAILACIDVIVKNIAQGF